MLLRRQALSLGAQRPEGLGDIHPGVRRGDDRVDIAALGGDIRVGEGLLVVLDEAGAGRVDIPAGVDDILDLLAVEDVHRALGAHDGDLPGWPGQVDIGAEVLGAHDVIRPAVGLPGDDGDLGDGRLGIRIDELGAAPDDAIPLLAGAGEEAGNVDEGEDRDIEGVAGADEPSGLLRGVDIEAAGVLHRLVGDHADGAALDAGEPGEDIRREQRHDFEEVRVVDDMGDDGVHVIGDIRRVGDERVEEAVVLGHLEVGLDVVGRRVLHVVAREEGQQRLDVLDGVVLVGAHVVGIARLGVVRPGAAELLEADLLAGDRLDDVGSGDEHVRGLVDHDGEVGDGGGVDGTTSTGAHDEGDLRHDAAGHDIAVEDLAVEAERDHALLDAGATGVVDADDRAADLHRKVHDLDDLLAEDLAEGAAEDGEVLGEDRHRPAVDGAIAGDDAVAIRPVLLLAELVAAVPGVLVHLDERALVEEQLDPLPGGLLALGVLLLHRACRASIGDLGNPTPKIGELAGGRAEVDRVCTRQVVLGHAAQPSDAADRRDTHGLRRSRPGRVAPVTGRARMGVCRSRS